MYKQVNSVVPRSAFGQPGHSLFAYTRPGSTNGAERTGPLDASTSEVLAFNDLHALGNEVKLVVPHDRFGEERAFV
jgi:hypothetical protein